MSGLALGIDVGSGGVRCAALDETGQLCGTARIAHTACDPDKINAENWWQAVCACIALLGTDLRRSGHAAGDVTAIAVDGTSGSMVLTDRELRPVTRALMYNSSGFAHEAERIARYAPATHITRGSGSALARFLRLQGEDEAGAAAHLCHQADFILARLAGRGGWSDDNNALKTGYDPGAASWPSWFGALGIRMELLPRIGPPGTRIGQIDRAQARQVGVSPDAMLHLGTTDSMAAYIAAAGAQPDSAVTSLGTTLAIKQGCRTRIDVPELGLYSHRLGDMWLAGGASNSGGGVLATWFSAHDIERLCARIDPHVPSGLDYYPLTRPGERFPVNDPELKPRLTPRPDDDAQFLCGLLEGIATIEARGYALLQKLGAPPPAKILTAGGGSANATWRAIRARILALPVEQAACEDACIGTARLCICPGSRAHPPHPGPAVDRRIDS